MAPVGQMMPIIKSKHPLEELQKLGSDAGIAIEEAEFSKLMDKNDPLRDFRKLFYYPKMSDLNDTDLSLVKPEDDSIYLCGNSLGLCPRSLNGYMERQIAKWAMKGVQGHTTGELPWAYCDEWCEESMAKVVGGKQGEVACMNGLTVNLHLLLVSFYKPTKDRYKIICESKAFPSDHYCFESQIQFRGRDPKECLICIEPREGEDTLRTEDILEVIEKEGSSVAVVCLPGVQYYTGQLFDIPAITKAAQKQGCHVGWDLAHAVGNVPLYLHDWNVDFAAWCSYKYLNSGAGGIAGAFLHTKHKNNDFDKMLGWWGHKMETRFVMDNKMQLSPGIHGYRISNPSGFSAASLRASLDIFDQTSMEALRAKSLLLTAYMEALIDHRNKTNPDKEPIGFLTPRDPGQRGAQLSLVVCVPVDALHQELTRRGVVCDERKPSVIRVAPAPLYCSFEDVHRFMGSLEAAITAVTATQAAAP